MLQPARSRDRQAVLSIEGFDGFVSSPVTPIATGWSDPVAGRELHPLKIRAFSRRTMSPFLSAAFDSSDKSFMFVSIAMPGIIALADGGYCGLQ